MFIPLNAKLKALEQSTKQIRYSSITIIYTTITKERDKIEAE